MSPSSSGDPHALYERARRVAERAGVRVDLPATLPELVPEDGRPGVVCGADVELRPTTRADRIPPGNLVVVLPGAHLDRCSFVFRGKGNVVVIGPDARLKLVALRVGGRDGTAVVGARSTWASGTLISGGWHGAPPVSVVVGADCMISNGVVLRTTDSHGIFDAGTGERLNDPEDVLVHEHVWLGNGARASKGARIDANAILGQLSLATGTLQPGGLYAGVPAKLLRSRVTWSRSASWDDIPEEYAGADSEPGTPGPDEGPKA